MGLCSFYPPPARTSASPAHNGADAADTGEPAVMEEPSVAGETQNIKDGVANPALRGEESGAADAGKKPKKAP